MQELAQHHQKLQGSLCTKHREHFSLDDSLKESEFNQDQVFVVVTNGVDRDTMEAIRYWNKRGLDIVASPIGSIQSTINRMCCSMFSTLSRMFS